MPDITWYYHVIDDATVRAPIDLDTLEIDWLRIEPWTEPPSKVNDDPMYCYKCKRSMCKHIINANKTQRQTVPVPL
jgi:hypothetical protein